MNKIRDGDLYKNVTVSDKTFELRYGYYDEKDRESKFSEPIPIYPDFKTSPVYTSGGELIVTAMQDVCENFEGDSEFDICRECSFFKIQEELFGICSCPKNHKEKHSI